MFDAHRETQLLFHYVVACTCIARARESKSALTWENMWNSWSLYFFKMASGLAVGIAIESLLESEVEEISRDGQEKYVP